MGTRYGGLKQLEEIGPSGETIIDYSVFDAVEAGFDKIVFIIREDFSELFRKNIGSNFDGRVETVYVNQSLDKLPEGFSVPEGRLKPWGTGHAMLTAADAVNEPFIIINADDFYGRDSFRITSEYLDGIADGSLSAALGGFRLKNTLSPNGTVSRGICRAGGDGRLDDVVEVHGIFLDGDGNYKADGRSDLSADSLVSMNMWAFSPSVFDFADRYFRDFLNAGGKEMKSEFYIPLIVNRMINEENLRVDILDTDSKWYGVTYKEDRKRITGAVGAMTAAGLYPEKLWGPA